MKTLDALEPLIAEHIDSMGFEFVGMEFLPEGKGFTLRIYADNQGGISLDQCAQVSKELAMVLDAEDAIQNRYNLEVSSPGLNRPLFKLADYQQFLDHKITVRLFKPLDDRRKIQGKLTAVTEASITINAEQQQVIEIPFADIKSARLVPDISFNKQSK